MIKLYTDDEFNLAKSNEKLKLQCENCDKIMLKQKRSIKYGFIKYEGRQNELCQDCMNKKKIIILKAICGNCLIEFEYRRSSRKVSDIKLCSKKCRNEYLKKCNDEKRELINKKISDSLKRKTNKKRNTNGKIIYIKCCKWCNVEFCNLQGRTNYCCNECKNLFMNNIFKSDTHRLKMSNALKGRAGGLRDGGGYSKMIEYINLYGEKMKLNSSEIEIAKALDALKIKWNRNKIGFKYKNIKGENRKYYPDFYITEYDIFIEYKGFVTEEMRHKMKESVKLNKFDLLIIYSGNKRYREMGLNEVQIKNNNTLIIEHIKKIKNITN